MRLAIVGLLLALPGCGSRSVSRDAGSVSHDLPEHHFEDVWGYYQRDAGGSSQRDVGGPGDGPLEVPPDCLAIASESGYCLSLRGASLVTLGLDTGKVCTGPTVQNSSDVTSLGWLGGAVYACSISLGGLTKIAVADGSVQHAPMECFGVTTAGGELLVLPVMGSDTLIHYESFASAAQGTVLRQTSHKGLLASRLGARGDRVAFAWHSTDHLQRGSIAGGPLQSLQLAGYDGWVNGVEIMPSGDVLIIDQEGSLRRFDGTTGASQKLKVAVDGLSGLKCTWR